MTTRYRCPISTCGWSHDAVATNLPTNAPSDPLLWSAVTWTLMSEWVGRVHSVAQIIDAHLATHSPVQWMTEIRRERERAEAAEAHSEALESAVKTAADFTSAMDAITTLRMPSRAEYEAAKAGLLAAVEEVGVDA